MYLTWDTGRLPAYGDRVVAVVLGDEAGGSRSTSTACGRSSRATASGRSRRAGPLRDRSPTRRCELAQCSVRWLRWLPGGAAQAHLAPPRRAAAPARRCALIPLGTYNQLDLPLVPIEERATDVFFAGQRRARRHPARPHGIAQGTQRREMLTPSSARGAARPGCGVICA